MHVHVVLHEGADEEVAMVIPLLQQHKQNKTRDAIGPSGGRTISRGKERIDRQEEEGFSSTNM